MPAWKWDVTAYDRPGWSGRFRGRARVYSPDGRQIAMRFRAGATIVKRAAAEAGIEGDFSGLSLRAGFATAAAVAGVAPHNIMRQTRHRQLHSLDRYVPMAGIFRDNPAAQLGL